MTKFLFTTIFISIFFYSNSQNRTIDFEHNKPWKEIIEKAKKENKIIFIDCYTTWCGPCKWIAKNVFTKDNVADFFNEKFVCAKIDMEKGEGPAIAKKFGVKAYPTLLYINSNEEKVHVTVGSVNAETLIRSGKVALNPEKNYLGQKTKYNKGERDSEFIYGYLGVLKSTYDPSLAKVSVDYFKSQKKQDLYSKINWKIITEYIEDIDSEIMQHVITNKTRYIEKYGKKNVENKIFNTCLNDFYKIFQTRSLPVETYNKYKDKYSKRKFDRLDEIFVNGDIIFYKYFGKDAVKYSDKVVKLIETYGLDDSKKLNDFAWDFFEKVNDKLKLNKAKSWSKKACELDASASNLDTYSALHYKLGEYKKALEIENKALKKAEEAGEDTKSYKEFIEKIKKAQK